MIEVKGANISELKLMRGSPIEIEGMGMLHQFTIGELESIGEKKYENWLQMLSIETDVLKNLLNIDEGQEFTTFDFIIANCLMGDGSFLEDTIEALSFIFKKEVVFIEEKACFVIGDRDDNNIISKENYELFRMILRLTNSIDKKEDVVENPSNAKAAEILKKRKEARKKLKEAKANQGNSDPLTWGDLVSILCANGNGITLENVWNMSVYSFNKQFVRMQMLEEYDISIRSLLAGAKKEDIELKHWMSAI